MSAITLEPGEMDLSTDSILIGETPTNWENVAVDQDAAGELCMAVCEPIECLPDVAVRGMAGGAVLLALATLIAVLWRTPAPKQTKREA